MRKYYQLGNFCLWFPTAINTGVLIGYENREKKKRYSIRLVVPWSTNKYEPITSYSTKFKILGFIFCFNKFPK